LAGNVMLGLMLAPVSAAAFTSEPPDLVVRIAERR